MERMVKISAKISALPYRRMSAVLVMAAFAAGAGLTTSACGSEAVASDAVAATTATTTVSTSSTEAVTTPTETVTSSTEVATQAAGDGLFDSSVVHAISVEFAQEDYDAMIETYKDSGEKDWIEATVTIDGTTYEDVGMRLKGNSSIRGLKDGRTGGPGGDLSAADPQTLPWLIRLDKNVDGQHHAGITDLVIRSNTWETSLNEAVSLELLEMAGLASQKAIAVSLTVNGSDAALRLATEHPEDVWMAERFSGSGALYKAESTGDYTYRGDDPDMYTEVFDQEAGKDNADLTPLIQFLDFVNNADDATFAETLPQVLDIHSFATYLAMEELIDNFDDIDGPGNNSYLYYDPAIGTFTVVPWDHNLAFGGMGGGGDAGGGREAPGNAPEDTRSPRSKANVLVQRFHANAEFEALYQERLVELKTQLYGSGAAADVLDTWVTLLKTQASDLVDPATVDAEAAKISAYFSAG